MTKEQQQVKEGSELALHRQLSQSKIVMSTDQLNKSQLALYGKHLDKFLYKPYMPLPDLVCYYNKFLEVRVHKSYLTRRNKAVKQRNFFGNDQYTSNSDICCILQHSGLFALAEDEDEFDMGHANFEALAVVFKVQRARNNYPS